MGAKFKSKTHLQNTFFDFLSRFLRVWLQSLKKVLIWPKKIFFKKNRKRCQKTQNFTLISNPLKKLWKNAPKTENLFYECILEFNYATIKGFA